MALLNVEKNDILNWYNTAIKNYEDKFLWHGNSRSQITIVFDELQYLWLKENTQDALLRLYNEELSESLSQELASQFHETQEITYPRFVFIIANSQDIIKAKDNIHDFYLKILHNLNKEEREKISYRDISNAMAYIYGEQTPNALEIKYNHETYNSAKYFYHQIYNQIFRITAKTINYSEYLYCLDELIKTYNPDYKSMDMDFACAFKPYGLYIPTLEIIKKQNYVFSETKGELIPYIESFARNTNLIWIKEMLQGYKMLLEHRHTLADFPNGGFLNHLYINESFTKYLAYEEKQNEYSEVYKLYFKQRYNK